MTHVKPFPAAIGIATGLAIAFWCSRLYSVRDPVGDVRQGRTGVPRRRKPARFRRTGIPRGLVRTHRVGPASGTAGLRDAEGLVDSVERCGG